MYIPYGEPNSLGQRGDRVLWKLISIPPKREDCLRKNLAIDEVATQVSVCFGKKHVEHRDKTRRARVSMCRDSCPGSQETQGDKLGFEGKIDSKGALGKLQIDEDFGALTTPICRFEEHHRRGA